MKTALAVAAGLLAVSVAAIPAPSFFKSSVRREAAPVAEPEPRYMHPVWYGVPGPSPNEATGETTVEKRDPRYMHPVWYGVPGPSPDEGTDKTTAEKRDPRYMHNVWYGVPGPSPEEK